MYLAIEEVLGRSGVNAALCKADLDYRINNYPPDNLMRQFCFEEVSRLQTALELLYGKKSSSGLAVIWGKTVLRNMVHELGSELGLNGLSFRLMPASKKIHTGIGQFASFMNQHANQLVQVSEDEKNIYWSVTHCSICHDRKMDSPACHLTVGVLTELLTWISGGKQYLVEETACVAKGDPACVVQMAKTATE